MSDELIGACIITFVIKDGRLQIGDHLVHINDIIVRGMGAEQVAVVLRHYVGMSVRMVVVRCIAELLPEHQYNTQAPVIATAHLDAHLQRIIAVIMALEIADSDTDSRRVNKNYIQAYGLLQ